jgi:cobalt/nickel transport system permease protein
MPKTLATVFLLSYRFLFVSSDEIADVLDAVHSRSGGVIRGFAKQSRLFAGIFGLAFIHAFERAERISKAMESRAFTGELPIVETVPRPSAAGLAAIALAGAVVAVSAYIRYFEPGLALGW